MLSIMIGEEDRRQAAVATAARSVIGTSSCHSVKRTWPGRVGELAQAGYLTGSVIRPG